jgi:hypothetical protein
LVGLTGILERLVAGTGLAMTGNGDVPEDYDDDHRQLD